MEQTVTLHIPYDWIEGISEEELTLQHIFRLGLYQYRVEQAITLYRSGVGSPGYIAEQTGLSRQTLIREFRLRGFEPDFSEQTILEEAM
jgi:hypothetical protein